MSIIIHFELKNKFTMKRTRQTERKLTTPFIFPAVHGCRDIFAESRPSLTNSLVFRLSDFYQCASPDELFAAQTGQLLTVSLVMDIWAAKENNGFSYAY